MKNNANIIAIGFRLLLLMVIESIVQLIISFLIRISQFDFISTIVLNENTGKSFTFLLVSNAALLFLFRLIFEFGIRLIVERFFNTRALPRIILTIISTLFFVLVIMNTVSPVGEVKLASIFLHPLKGMPLHILLSVIFLSFVRVLIERHKRIR